MPAPYGDQTGNTRFRTGWRGRMVLQVEYEKHRDTAMGGSVLDWRDAVPHDLLRVRHMRKVRGMEPLI